MKHNTLKLSFTNTCALSSNFVECESFLESNSLDILSLCETNLDDLMDSGNFSVKGYIPLIWKDSITVFQFIWRQDFLLLRTYLKITLRILTYVFDWLYFTQYLISFSSIDHLLHFYAKFFQSISSNIG